MRHLKGPAAVLAALLVMSVTPLASAQTLVPSFSKRFVPATIGPGSSATLTFDIVNKGAPPVDNLAFTDTLPAGVTIATPASVRSTCGGEVTAPDGGATISFTGGRLGTDAGCTIRVNVTSATPGTHTNVSGDLTSTAGNSGPAIADLIVDGDRPGFSKSFVPASIPPGGTSVLTLIIDNTFSEFSADFLAFFDPLPAGVVVATPANAATDCNGLIPATLTAAPGSSTVSLSNGFVGGGSSCEVTVDVTAVGTGRFVNTTLELTSSFGAVSSGFATALLDVPVEFLVKSFTGDPVAPGDTVTLDFTVTNPSRTEPATSISFTDDLDATLSGLVAVGLPLSDPCGAGSQLTGTSLLTLTGGNLPAEGSCAFSVTLLVPGSAAKGSYPNTTSAVTADVGGEAVTGNQATDSLVVSTAPKLTKTFTDDPVAPGGTVTLQFTITNASATAGASNIGFIDELTTFLPFPVSATLPSTPCGAGSSMTLVSLGTDRQGLSLSGGSLAAGASCTFDVLIDIPLGVPSGNYVNVTSDLTGTVGGAAEAGKPATDTLTVVAAPTLTKSFLGDPVAPGGTVDLEFTLTSDDNAPGVATGVGFMDDLDAALSGLAAVGLPASDVCGTGSQLSGTSALNLSGASLAPGDSCTFSATLQVPAGAVPGTHTNTTSRVTATVLGLAVTGNPATDGLVIQGPLSLTKDFTDDPVPPGGTATLQFTVANDDPTLAATSIAFSDDLDAALSGLVAVGLPASDVCGAGSVLSGAGLITLSGGVVGPQSSCTFDVTLQVPAGAAFGDHVNATSGLTANLDGSPAAADPATAGLTVDPPLGLIKSFSDDPVRPGGIVTLDFTISYAGQGGDATAIGFTDDLGAVLPGLTAEGLPANDVCGAGSQLSGTGVITLTGGALTRGESCTFSASVRVPVGSADGVYRNTTSQVSAQVAGNPLTGDPASDVLRVVSAGLEFVPVTPRACFDTRAGQALAAGETRGFFVLGAGDFKAQGGPATGCGIPQDAEAVMLNLVAIDGQGKGRLGIAPRGAPRSAAVVEFQSLTPKMNNSNAVPVRVNRLGASGHVDIKATGAGAHVRGVAVGYFTDPAAVAAPGLLFVPVTPTTCFDTRSASAGALGFSSSRPFRVIGTGDFTGQGGLGNGCGVPASAEAVLLNLVAIDPQGGGNLKVSARGTAPAGGVVNYQSLTPKMNNSNAVPVRLNPAGVGGEIDVASNGAAVHVRGVALGYYVPRGTPGGFLFTPTVPVGCFDTRTGAPLAGNTFRTFRVLGEGDFTSQGGLATGCGVPVDADSVMLNLLAADPLGGGNLKVAAQGTAPGGGVVNYQLLTPSMDNSNAVPVRVNPAGIGGEIDVFANSRGTHVTGVVLGYHATVRRVNGAQ